MPNLFNEMPNTAIGKLTKAGGKCISMKIIIIAIEHAEEDRINEYNVGRTVLGKGQGKSRARKKRMTPDSFVTVVYRTG
jgi:hypothetical protein